MEQFKLQQPTDNTFKHMYKWKKHLILQPTVAGGFLATILSS